MAAILEREDTRLGSETIKLETGEDLPSPYSSSAQMSTEPPLGETIVSQLVMQGGYTRNTSVNPNAIVISGLISQRMAGSATTLLDAGRPGSQRKLDLRTAAQSALADLLAAESRRQREAEEESRFMSNLLEEDLRE